MALRPLLVGNWKMNGLKSALTEAEAIAAALRTSAPAAGRPDLIKPDVARPVVMICPPATLIAPMAAILSGSELLIGAQDCHALASGAFTGDLSSEMLADAGARAVIVGHSERRAAHGERDCDVKAKVAAAHRAGLTAIVCVGETLGQRAAGLTEAVVRRQLARSLPDLLPDKLSDPLTDGVLAANTVVAYEPVWAIGSGLTPSIDDVARVHAALADELGARFGEAGRSIRVLYGGSVKASNARALMAVPNVHGALVGGASLKAADFIGILDAFG
ncbi:MAG: triose-phosphate isomerase [Hyphomicrobium aestuarii]|nr:triose-phosphate isomerase [Hyphomicrobium aestuarii]